MIEIIFQKFPSRVEGLRFIYELLNWLTNEWQTDTEMRIETPIDGYFVLEDKTKDAGFYIAFLLTKSQFEANVLNILKQPPGEFKGKYIANCHNDDCVEPVVVCEKKEDAADETILKDDEAG